MGVDIGLYRARIGLHLARFRAPKSSANFTDCTGAWTPQGENFSLMNREHRSRMYLSLSQPKIAIYGMVFYVSLLLMCNVKPRMPPNNLHDLTPRLLLAMDIEANPGPTAPETVSTDLHCPQASFLQQNLDRLRSEIIFMNANLSNKIENTELAYDTCLSNIREDICCLQNYVQWMNYQHNQLRLNTYEALKQWQQYSEELSRRNYALQKDNDAMKVQMSHLCSVADGKLNTACDGGIHTDRAMQQRFGVRLFGVSEKRMESRYECLHMVLSLLHEAIPDGNWAEGIVGTQRLDSNDGGPRPVLVTFAELSQKLLLLRRGREHLRRMGVRVSGNTAPDQQSRNLAASSRQNLPERRNVNLAVSETSAEQRNTWGSRRQQQTLPTKSRRDYNRRQRSQVGCKLGGRRTLITVVRTDNGPVLPLGRVAEMESGRVGREVSVSELRRQDADMDVHNREDHQTTSALAVSSPQQTSPQGRKITSGPEGECDLPASCVSAPSSPTLARDLRADRASSAETAQPCQTSLTDAERPRRSRRKGGGTQSSMLDWIRKGEASGEGLTGSQHEDERSETQGAKNPDVSPDVVCASEGPVGVWEGRLRQTSPNVDECLSGGSSHGHST